MTYVIILLVLILLVFAVIGLQYLTRGNPINQVRPLGPEPDPPAASDPHLREVIHSHIKSGLHPGNRVDVLVSGDGTYPRLWEDLRAAEDLITWHVFWFKPGRLADTVREILIERARAGVQVLFLHDAFGSRGIGDDYLAALADAGIEVARFRPARLSKLYRYQQRSHTRAVVIDGRVGYTGGFGIDDRWAGDGRHPDQWRDTSARLEGPVVAQLQTAFVADWAEATGDLLTGTRLFPTDLDGVDGPTYAGLMYSAPSIGSTDAERFLALSVGCARETLYITDAYFVPDDDLRRWLLRAVDRGVDVRVLTPGANTDKKSTWYASRVYYEELLAGGVRLFEYRPTMVHAKTFVADRVWASIGTINFDNRSISLNDEVALMTHDEDIGARLHDLFLEDIEHARELNLERFRSRAWTEKVKERAYKSLSRVL